MTTSIWLAAEGEVAAQRAADALARRGFRLVRSFDLRSAVAGHSQCACPHHGTDQCTCQFVVLLAYGAAGAPVVITAHSCDCLTELQMVDDPNAPTEAAAGNAVLAALAEAALTWQAQPAGAEVGAG